MHIYPHTHIHIVYVYICICISCVCIQFLLELIKVVNQLVVVVRRGDPLTD